MVLLCCVQENEKIRDLESEMSLMVRSATMFEVVVPEYKQLKACRRELVMIKNVWDHITIIHTTFDNWKSTPWRQINIELMDQECKKFAKELRVLDKETRAWDAYNGAENTVKNMMTSLRAVGELQNPSIRDRHWTQLMQATGVSHASRPNFTGFMIEYKRANRAVFDGGGSWGFDPPQEVAAPQKVLQNLFGRSTLPP